MMLIDVNEHRRSTRNCMERFQETFSDFSQLVSKDKTAIEWGRPTPTESEKDLGEEDYSTYCAVCKYWFNAKFDAYHHLSKRHLTNLKKTRSVGMASRSSKP